MSIGDQSIGDNPGMGEFLQSVGDPQNGEQSCAKARSNTDSISTEFDTLNIPQEGKKDTRVKINQRFGTLDEAEKAIERFEMSAFEAGIALSAVHTRKLYRGEFDSFSVYCRERWGFSYQRAHQLIRGGEIYQEISTTVDDVNLLPRSEGQIRPLNRLQNRRDAPKVWKFAVEEAGQNPVTALTISEVAGRNGAKRKLRFIERVLAEKSSLT